MLHTKYQWHRPCTFRQEEFLFFPTEDYVKYVSPQAGPFFSPRGYNLNNLGSGPLGEAIY